MIKCTIHDNQELIIIFSKIILPLRQKNLFSLFLNTKNKVSKNVFLYGRGQCTVWQSGRLSSVWRRFVSVQRRLMAARDSLPQSVKYLLSVYQKLQRWKHVWALYGHFEKWSIIRKQFGEKKTLLIIFYTAKPFFSSYLNSKTK